MANPPVVTYIFALLTAISGPPVPGLMPTEVARYLQWELYLRILESFYAHLLGKPPVYVTEALRLWTVNGLLTMGNGRAFSWGSLRVFSDNISRARLHLREAKANPSTPLPTPHEKALYRLAILMHQMGQAPLPAAALPVIQGVVPVQRLLRLAPPTPVQSSAEADGDTEDLAGDHDISAGRTSAEEAHVSSTSQDDDRTVAACSRGMQDENDLSQNAAEEHHSDVEDASEVVMNGARTKYRSPETQNNDQAAEDSPEDDRVLAAAIEPLQQTISQLARNRKHLKKEIKRLQGTVQRLTNRGHQ